MNQLSALAQKDARIVYRDRFMLFIALYALVIAIACRIIVPWIPVLQLDFYLAPAVVLTGPFLLGTLMGFALIEEREQGTWLLIRVLPVRPLRVFAYLSLSATALSFVMGLAAALVYGFPLPDWPVFLLMLATTSLSAPLVMLFLAAFSSNKIEGMAYSKIVSLTGMTPAAIFVVPPDWQLLGAWCPWYWIYLGLLEAYAGDRVAITAAYWPDYPLWLMVAASLVLSLAGALVMARRYTRLAL